MASAAERIKTGHEPSGLAADSWPVVSPTPKRELQTDCGRRRSVCYAVHPDGELQTRPKPRFVTSFLLSAIMHPSFCAFFAPAVRPARAHCKQNARFVKIGEATRRGRLSGPAVIARRLLPPKQSPLCERGIASPPNGGEAIPFATQLGTFLIRLRSPSRAARRMGPMYSSTISAVSGTGMFSNFILSWGSLAAVRARAI